MLWSAATAVLIAFAGCSTHRKTPANRAVADVRSLPQKAEPYLKGVHEHTTILPMQHTYAHHYYSVWQDTYVPDDLETVRWPFRTYTPDDAYGANLRPLPPAWFAAMRDEANWSAYNSVSRRAVALKALDLRNFPTDTPLFHDPDKAGEGFPFDYLQNSTVYAMEPLHLSHYSKSGKWAYVLTSYATGWVHADAVAAIDDKTATAWMHRPLLALLNEHEPVQTTAGRYLFDAHVGMVVPLAKRESGRWICEAAIASSKGRAVPAECTLPYDGAAPVPLLWNRHNLARVIDAVTGTAYGWGGLYGGRDCSSTIRDIFAPFGIWLPRNSSQQAAIGKVVSLHGLDAEAKRRKIIKEGKPFETLLYLKGHILLYLGVYRGNPVALHTVWGIKVFDESGKEGRKIIGKTVVTTLEPGRELPGFTEASSILQRLESMNFVLDQ